jgi:hypothetical protein
VKHELTKHIDIEGGVSDVQNPLLYILIVWGAFLHIVSPVHVLAFGP